MRRTKNRLSTLFGAFGAERRSLGRVGILPAAPGVSPGAPKVRGTVESVGTNGREGWKAEQLLTSPNRKGHTTNVRWSRRDAWTGGRDAHPTQGRRGAPELRLCRVRKRRRKTASFGFEAFGFCA